jgi:hypothetical protein
MKTVMRPRYYCDYCKRGTGSAAFMRRHESSCTANPNRTCRMCGVPTPDVKAHAAILTRPGDWPMKMDALREETENCPCCILAAIRLSGVQKFDPPEAPAAGGEYRDPFEGMGWDTPGYGYSILGFHFKAEKAEYLAQRAREYHENIAYY